MSQARKFFNVHFQILPPLTRGLRSFRAHQCSSNQMQILKDRSPHTTTAVGIAYCLWLFFSINKVFNLTKLKSIIYIYIYIYIYYIYISVILGYINIIQIYIYFIYYIYQINPLYYVSNIIYVYIESY